MKFKKMHWMGLALGIIILIIDLISFYGEGRANLFLFLIGIAFTVIVLPFIMGIILENKKEQEMSEMFLEFSRNLAESVAVGTPVSKSIINLGTRNYGLLSPHIIKLANQISIGIPLNQAFQTFAYEVDNPVITRAIELISEAEKAGGDIDYILESAAKSIAEVEKLKKERKAAIYSLVVEGYIIFFIFIGIMLVMEFKILPLVSGIGSYGGFNGDIASINTASTGVQTQKFSTQDLARPLLYLLITQGFFVGIVIGKLTEGSIKAGIRHSFILMVAAFMIVTGARLAAG